MFSYCRSLGFFFSDPATTEFYTLSLHDALPISWCSRSGRAASGRRGRRRASAARRARCGRIVPTPGRCRGRGPRRRPERTRSEEHTSELQSRQYLVCRLLLEKKKKEVMATETSG